MKFTPSVLEFRANSTGENGWSYPDRNIRSKLPDVFQKLIGNGKTLLVILDHFGACVFLRGPWAKPGDIHSHHVPIRRAIDLQYIANPGGAGLDDAWVATLRLELVY